MNNIFNANDAEAKSRRKRRYGCPSHIWFCMKLTVFLSLFLTFHVSASTMAQKVNLQVKDASFRAVMNTVQQQTGYSFVAREALLKVAKPISIDIKSKEIVDVLPMLFEGQPFSYQVNGKVITLTDVTGKKSIKTDAAVKKVVLQQTIHGKVTAEDGSPLTGVSVQIKGTTSGTITNENGLYTIELSNSNPILVFRYLGFASEEVSPSGRSEVNIVLKVQESDLDEVVVVGYGTQRKKDLTGAISSLKGEDISRRKTAQVSTALQGAVPGLMVRRNNNAPGAAATLNIRGITTIGDSSPLIIMDGVPVTNINDIHPSDIENISVLKDGAAASIYGSRAASGVIVITTKRATEGTSLDYNVDYGVDMPTQNPEYVGAIRFMEMTNELRWNDAGNGSDEFPTYSRDLITNYYDLHEREPNLYPLTDWQELIQSRYASRQNHSLSIMGGSKNIRTKGTVNHDRFDGLYEHISFKRTMARINNDIKINNMLAATFDVRAKLTEYNDPITNPVSAMRLMPGIYAATWQDGRVAEGKSGNNPYAASKYGGTDVNNYYQLGGKIGLDFTPVQGLKFSGTFAPTYNFTKGKAFRKKLEYHDPYDPYVLMGLIDGHTTTRLSETRNDNNFNTIQFIGDYNRKFGNHDFSAMAGYESYYYFSESLSASRDEYEIDTYPYLSVGPLELRDNAGGAYEVANRSYFGRLGYNYQGRYLLQANIRYDGSSRFAKTYRWGAFPSFSAGWVVSEEEFLKDNSLLTFLKFRASWGALGNERIGSYPYQALLSYYNALFYQGNTVVSNLTAAQVQYAVENITWESTESLNFGLDATLLTNRLRITADYYNKRTRDMLLRLEIPGYVGYDNPDQNAGKMRTKGFDLDLGWRDKVDDWNYGISLNVSDFVSRMGNLKGTEFLGSQIRREGSEFDEWYGYRSDGLFQTEDDLINSPILNSSVRVGDIKFVDISGPHGEPDGVINHYDKVLLGGSLPRYSYGGNFYVGYKNIDLSIDVQGVGKQNARLTARMVQPLAQDWGNMPAHIDGNYWSHYNTDEQNLNARYPALSYTNRTNNYDEMSDFWLLNGQYFRLKNVTLGYIIEPQNPAWQFFKRSKVYLSATDLFFMSRYPKGWDPEVGTTSYPITTTLIMGLSVQF